MSKGQSYDGPRCTGCGAARAEDARHKHELPNWKPLYDDFEGVLEGYETVVFNHPSSPEAGQE